MLLLYIPARYRNKLPTHVLLYDAYCCTSTSVYILGERGAWSSRKSHTTRRRGHLRVAISTVSDPSGSGRVDMLTSPVAAARAVVATGAWVTSKHMCLIWELKFYFYPSAGGFKKKKRKKKERPREAKTAIPAPLWHGSAYHCYLFCSFFCPQYSPPFLAYE